MTDLLAATAALVAIASESHHETAIADHVEGRLRAVPWLQVDRVGDNVVARSAGDGPRTLLAGHLDTVPANGNADPVVEGDVLRGLGSADMKGGLAVMLELAETLDVTARPVTYVFYAAEEVARADNGLLAIDAARPDLLAADVAILGEPTGAVIEAGCQGVLKARVTLGGRRAHTARPWMGVNALHRLSPLLAAVAGASLRQPVLDGCTYREALSAVSVEGGVAGNVVPDRASVVISHRFAPDRTEAEAEAWLRQLLAPHLDAGLGDEVEIVDVAPAAPPGLDHPVLQALQATTDGPPRAKLGWTDVAFFAGRGTPAVNFGPGDPELAHTPQERVERADLDAAHRSLRRVLVGGA
ncbi:succinyl-diaminopimelate desuccinylase [Acidiferrimicrobium sp. IK]|uniref:succinyl-diaminopimelate desuccinylase n=1 Tax=Acidiferrimicrobium sp. IK TaxID=2871700 RepID=UPI0021CB1F14|nr:succinyl-diaminopimelate desuccinylase [Acidiferrimicrobium sp. IK]MCU4183712.1 succinyl-diaminopimelate desuccinylase [Acidiferrimicrobium sp. IK]